MPIKRKFIPDARSVLGLLVPAALLLAVLPMGERRAWGDNPVPTQPETIPALQVHYRLNVLADRHSYHGEYFVPTAGGDGLGGGS